MMIVLVDQRPVPRTTRPVFLPYTIDRWLIEIFRRIGWLEEFEVQ